MTICVVDGRGGGLGRHLVRCLRRSSGVFELIGVATNAVAARSISDAGVTRVMLDNPRGRQVLTKADLILGPLGIVLPGSLCGEVTPGLAAAVLHSPARKWLLPINPFAIEVIGAEGRTLDALVQQVVRRVERACDADESS